MMRAFGSVVFQVFVITLLEILNLSAPGMVETLVYPAETSVEARWSGISLDPLLVGPYPAEPGSTWEILQTEEKGIPLLQKVIDVPLNADDAIVVRNVKPVGWSGRQYGIGVLKSNKLLMTQLQTLVGEQAMFVLEPILYFGVTRSDKFISQMFRSSEIAEICNALESFDLSNHPNGLKVILKESTDGRFTITGENM